MKISMTSQDFSDEYLELCQQIGLDGLDCNRDRLIPGFKEKGEADAGSLAQLARRLASKGLGLVCVNLPHPLRYMSAAAGGEEELEALGRSLVAFADAGIPIARVRVELPVVPRTHEVRQRGGYSCKAFDASRWQAQGCGTPWSLGLGPDMFWQRGLRLYEFLVPLAERTGIRLAMHPTDPPIPGAPFDAAGLDRLIASVPSAHSGLLYCVGTRGEQAGNALVLDEIRRYGAAGRILHVHLRNIRGNLARDGGFEEVLLDEGELDLPAILRALRETGYDGFLNPDHLPTLGAKGRVGSRSAESLCYAVGYLKGMMKGAATLPASRP